MQPFVVRWRLATPMVVPERPLHLDALLASARVDSHLRRGCPLEDALTQQENLPLAKADTPDGSWVWKASQLLFAPASPPANVQMTRRLDMETMSADRERVFTSRRQSVKMGTGPFRNYDLRFPVQWQSEVTAYGVGEVESVHQLLETIHSLGRLRRNGWGKVAVLSVEPSSPQAAEYWKRRTLPASFSSQALSTHQPAQGTCRPPYWDRTRWESVLEWVP
ncbi:MAG: hypothetical protein INR62_00800 [Rhodospirillales bacterium]|nr:hypothetical protein [Acetobacter sp.]